MRPSGDTASVRIWRPFSKGSVLLTDSVRLTCAVVQVGTWSQVLVNVL